MLKSHLWKYWKYNFEEILRIAKKNNIEKLDNIESKWKSSKTKIIATLNKSQKVQNEINALIFQLYGLDKSEVDIILTS